MINLFLSFFAAELATPSEGDIPMIVENVEGVFFRMIISFLLFILFAGASLYFLRRFLRGRGQRGPSQNIHLLEKKAISPKSMLYLVQVGEEKILIGESQVELRRLDQMKRESKRDLEEILQEKQEVESLKS